MIIILILLAIISLILFGGCSPIQATSPQDWPSPEDANATTEALSE